MSAIIINNEIVHYEVLGRGRPIMLIHGWVGSWRYWIPTMQSASISFRAYAIDLWGFGNSAKNERLYDIETQVALLDRFFEEMGIGKIALVGHGLGAIVAMHYAEKKPRFVDRVMGVAYPIENENINPRLIEDAPSELGGWLLGSSPDSDAARMEAPKADINAIQLSIQDINNLDLTNLPSRLSSPCLLVHGLHDPAITISLSDNSMELPEHTHQIIFEDSGHFPMLDEPSKFNRLLVDFLSLSSGESPRKLQLKEEWKRRVR